MEPIQKFDVVIAGGSYAGLAGAMSLGRALRTVLIVDGGMPCNRQTPHSHNFLTQDGETPAAIAAKAIQQVMAYPSVQHRQDWVQSVTGVSNDFTVTLASGTVVGARKLLFATGIKDELPVIEGFAECWGISAVHCPYCHGYEYRGEATGVLVNGDAGAEHALFLNNWAGSLTVFTNGPATISPEKRAALAANQIAVVETDVLAVEHNDGYITHIVLADGQRIALRVLYARPAFTLNCPIPEALGCQLTDLGYIQVDDLRKTNVAGVYAAGDIINPMRSVASSVGAGTMAGAAISRELISEDVVKATVQ